MAETASKLITQNRKARHEYHILSRVEAGLVLQGTEVKSLRRGQVNLKDSFARIENDEAWLHNMHISPYEEGNRFNHDPTRKRKLLLHRMEIKRLLSKVKEKGLTLVPLKVYFVRGRAKVELGLARGKREYDKREDIARRDMQRDIARQLRREG
ncbi:MAG: SsrA-binding protein [Candidatus Latescibacteria bacterium 4484_107]|nr:MAG: SsrA-binding protein [Candidatus Latescibacteria bacterium 4484_107]